MVVRLGNDNSIIDHNNGKIIFMKNQDIYYSNIKALNLENIKDNIKI